MLTGGGYFVEVFLVVVLFDVGFGELTWLRVRRGVKRKKLGTDRCRACRWRCFCRAYSSLWSASV